MIYADIIGYCENAAEAVDRGASDPLSTYAELKAIQVAVEEALNQVKPAAITVAERYPRKTFMHQGLTFVRTDGRRLYKFDHLHDWSDAKAVLAIVEARAKQAAELALTGATMLDDETGEIIQPAIVTFTEPTLSVK